MDYNHEIEKLNEEIEKTKSIRMWLSYVVTLIGLLVFTPIIILSDNPSKFLILGVVLACVLTCGALTHSTLSSAIKSYKGQKRKLIEKQKNENVEAKTENAEAKTENVELKLDITEK